MSPLLNKLRPWFEARKQFRLSHAHIQMARELGMNPRNFGSLANHRQEPWKLPLPEFIEECYEKRFGRTQPERVRTLEDIVQADEDRRKQRRERTESNAPALRVDADGESFASDNPSTG